MELATSEFIARELKETDFTVREQLAAVVSALGDHRAMALLERALEIQDAGGLSVKGGSRKRSTGGIFFHLARAELSREAKQRIFYGKGTGKASGPPPEAPASTPPPSANPTKARTEVVPTRTPIVASTPLREAKAKRLEPQASAEDPNRAPPTVSPATSPATASRAGRRRIVEVAPAARLKSRPRPEARSAQGASADGASARSVPPPSPVSVTGSSLKDRVRTEVEAALAKLSADQRYELLFDLMRAERIKKTETNKRST